MTPREELSWKLRDIPDYIHTISIYAEKGCRHPECKRTDTIGPKTGIGCGCEDWQLDTKLWQAIEWLKNAREQFHKRRGEE